MKKINYLMSMFAIVLALGVMSCDPNEVTPENPNGITLEDFDGFWETIETTYNGDKYHRSDACDALDFNDAVVDFNFNSTSSKLTATYYCNNAATATSTITNFNSETLTVTLSVGLVFQISNYNDTTKTMDFKLIDNGETASTQNIIYHLEK